MKLREFEEECLVCKEPMRADYIELIDENCYQATCLYCGYYQVTENLKAILSANRFFANLSFWIREQNENNIVPSLHENKVGEYYSIPDKTLRSKYEAFIRYCMKFTEIEFSEDDSPSENLDIRTVTWSKTNNDVRLLINKALSENHIVVKGEYEYRTTYLITFEGKEYIESLGHKTSSNKIFMAFHFTDEMKDQFESTIRRAVTDASENRLEAVRVSSSTTDHDTKIDDELIGMLKSSKAVIADFTGQRNAVYYEAGYAMGLGIPVIWTCRDTDADSLSFDTRQYPHIIWKDKDDLYTQVVNRLKAKIL